MWQTVATAASVGEQGVGSGSGCCGAGRTWVNGCEPTVPSSGGWRHGRTLRQAQIEPAQQTGWEAGAHTGRGED